MLVRVQTWGKFGKYYCDKLLQEFSNVIGYHQPDLSTYRTVYA